MACFVLLLLTLCVLSGVDVDAARIIRNGNNVHWTDTSGKRIEAHGGGILLDPVTKLYFWYGESAKTSNNRDHGVNAYSSQDLSGPWKFEGLVVKNSDFPNKIESWSAPWVVERPKVLYNNVTKQYVMWLHHDSEKYEMKHAAVFNSSSPRGPFSFVRSFSPDGLTSKDCTLWADTDGMPYFVRIAQPASGGESMRFSRLTNDSLMTTGVITSVGFFEAPALFRAPTTARSLFILGSHLTGWWPNEMIANRGDGADISKMRWVSQSNPTGDKTSYNSQPNWVYPTTNKCGKPYYIYMGDNWVYCGVNPNSYDLYNACTVWLPFRLDAAGLNIQHIDNLSQWDLDDPFGDCKL